VGTAKGRKGSVRKKEEGEIVGGIWAKKSGKSGRRIAN